jgi:predicted small lipoprotein YifL
MTRAALVILLALALAAPLAGCGKKGPPQPPPGKESTYPRTYPSE